MKKILVLGGTRFIGRTLVERLLAAGDADVTLFHRGRTGADLFPGLRRILGDRDTDDLLATAGEDWDAIVDLSCYFPRPLRRYLARIAGRVGRYVFVSTGSVYLRGGGVFREGDPLVPCPPEKEEDPSNNAYGPRKVACEAALAATPGLDAVILRPSIVYGPHDPTDRLYFWLRRAARRDRMLLPDGGAEASTWTAVGDLAAFLAEAVSLPRHRGIYNTPTHAPVALRDLAALAATLAGRRVEFVPVPAQTLRAAGVAPGTDLPLWFGRPFVLDGTRLAEDFATRPAPFVDSVAEAFDHYRALGFPPCRAGFDDAREDALLAAVPSRENR